MSFSRKFFTMVALTLVLLMTFTGLTSADVLQGKGWLHAEGNGLVNLHLTGEADIEGHGTGMVYIRGAEEIRANGSGRRIDHPGNIVVFYGYEGEIHATGEKMLIRMVGQKIEFTAEGKGRARLHGRGWYETGNGSTGDWAPDGLDIEMTEE